MSVELLRILLLSMLAIPLGAALVVAALGPHRGGAVRAISLLATVASLLLALLLANAFAGLAASPERESATGAPTQTPTFHPEIVPGASTADAHQTQWDLLSLGMGKSVIQFYIGLDGLNIWLVVLTALLMVSSVLASWDSPQAQERINEYYAWLLTLETGMLGVFLAFDIILFYVFFELTLVPLFFLIGIWGGPERRHAARKFFIYTLAGSLITLLGLMGIVLACHYSTGELTFSIPRLIENVNDHLSIQIPEEQSFWYGIQFWVLLAMIAGFAIKVPLVPFHTWLPLAHVEAPTAGSVLLAGVLLKIGAYGFLRLCLPLVPDACLSVGVPLIGTLAVVGIIYGALCALAQPDIKKLVAYSSVSHMGFCMLGMFALNLAGLSGSLLQMINHGLSTGALFLLVGMLYDRYHTRKIDDYGGMAARLRVLACFMVFICLSSIGLPGLNGFVGEALVLMGIFEFRPVLAILASAGVVLGAWYLLQMLMRVFFGQVKEPGHEGHDPVRDLNGRELASLIPIAVACVVLGVYPQLVLKTSEGDLEIVSRISKAAQDRASRAEARSQSRPPVVASLEGEKAP